MSSFFFLGGVGLLKRELGIDLRWRLVCGF